MIVLYEDSMFITDIREEISIIINIIKNKFKNI